MDIKVGKRELFIQGREDSGNNIKGQTLIEAVEN
jgi:hypothetical protein